MAALATFLIWLLMTIFWGLIGIAVPLIMPEKIENRRWVISLLYIISLFRVTSMYQNVSFQTDTDDVGSHIGVFLYIVSLIFIDLPISDSLKIL